MPKFKDITGQRSGKLVAVRVHHTGERNRRYWLCQCDCGNKTILYVGDFRPDRIMSCGCQQKESAKKQGYERAILMNTSENRLKANRAKGVIADTQVISMNCKTRSNNKSGYCGVCRHRDKWRAYIDFKKIRYDLGVFHKKRGCR